MNTYLITYTNLEMTPVESVGEPYRIATPRWAIDKICTPYGTTVVPLGPDVTAVTNGEVDELRNVNLFAVLQKSKRATPITLGEFLTETRRNISYERELDICRG